MSRFSGRGYITTPTTIYRGPLLPFVFNDGGRAAAGFQGSAGDCVARAVAIATKQPYLEIYHALAEIEASYRGRGAKGVRSAREGIHTKADAFKRFMRGLGMVWTPTMEIGAGCKVHLRPGELPAGRLVVKVSKHYTAVLDGTINDTYDPSRKGTRCVYGYWSFL